jgi:C-terminal peptidase prc
MFIRKNSLPWLLRSTILATAIFTAGLTSIVSAWADQPLAADVSEKVCNQLLDREAAMAYDQDGVKSLIAVKRACPVGGTLNDTLIYVDNLLTNAFDDPYTVVSPPDVAEQFQQRMNGTAKAFDGGGIGLNLSFDRTKTLPVAAIVGTPTADPELAFTGLIYHVFANSPAAKAGMMDGDIITKVNGENVIGLAASHVVVDLMHGPVGTKLTITAMRGATEKTFTMERAVVISDNVWSRDLGNGIYAIVVTEFRQHTASMIFNEMQKDLPKARGFVFDLRGNPGGMLEDAILAAAWFVHDGVIVSQRERLPGDPSDPKYVKITYTRVGAKVVVESVDESSGKVIKSYNMKLTMAQLDPKTGKQSHIRQTENIPFLGYKPMVVLANGMSASASEVFTGALSENYIDGKSSKVVKPGTKSALTDSQGATFLGVKTFGKFIGQTVTEGPMGVQVKATSFRYYSPKGHWLGDAHKHRIGLTPAINVEQPATAIPYTDSDVQLNAAIDLIAKGGHQTPAAP